MTTVVGALARFRDQPTPPEPTSNPFKLSSQLETAATSAEIERAWPDAPPEQLVEAWSVARQARLLVDVDHGQWGLVLLSPSNSAARTEKERAARPKDFEQGDVVIGEFLGDQELLVLIRDGRILVALPLDDRADWCVAADDVASFLNAYWQHGGDKFWESDARLTEAAGRAHSLGGHADDKPGDPGRCARVRGAGGGVLHRHRRAGRGR